VQQWTTFLTCVGIAEPDFRLAPEYGHLNGNNAGRRDHERL
jgi:hypothetical protein